MRLKLKLGDNLKTYVLPFNNVLACIIGIMEAYLLFVKYYKFRINSNDYYENMNRIFLYKKSNLV